MGQVFIVKSVTAPTNQEVYDALTHGIEVRWAYAAKHGKLGKDGGCRLCDIDDQACQAARVGVHKACSSCPLALNGMGCYLHTSPWRLFDRAPNKKVAKEEAKRMVQTLIDLREQYFGDWKKRRG